jgi:hypothetical protein
MVYSRARSSESRSGTHQQSQFPQNGHSTISIATRRTLDSQGIGGEHENIPTTCQWRIQRRVDGKPVRIC